MPAGFFQHSEVIRIPTRRHWAEIRKLLEQEFLCDALKGRVRYFATRYRRAHDQTGRVCILVDGCEIITTDYYLDTDISGEASRRRQGSDKSLPELAQEVRSEFHGRGIFSPGDFGAALDLYLSSPVEVSLHSSNWLVRLLAILDRRVGKRTLLKLQEEVPNLPEWLQYFYRLRLDAEHIQ